jgi:hypothetical protein
VEGLTGLRFTPAAVLGFEAKLAAKAKPLVADITKKIQSTDGAVYADETYWRLYGRRAYFWTHGTEQYNLFQFSMTRKGQVSRDVLGEYFAGVLVTDCYAGYDAQKARAKQKCLAHLARTARDWQKLVLKDSQAWRFFDQIKEWVKRGCRWHRRRHELTSEESAAEVAWLRAELPRLETCPLDHAKARRLQARLRRYHDDWLVFVAHRGVSPTNNLAERRLRPLVILRKITYGHRSTAGAERMADLMTVQETAKCHRHRVLDFYYELSMLPPDRALQRLYSGP